jgi:integrase
LADIITFAVNTGCREDEICKLEWSDVNFKEQLIHIRTKKVIENRRKADGQVETIKYEWKPKATQGVVPMNETVRALLQRLHSVRKSNFVFAQDDGGSCRLRLLRLTQRAAKQAGVKRIRFHDLRHTYGTLLRDSGVPLDVIMQLMRHADMHETLLYAKPSNQAAHEAVKRLEVA